MKPLLNCPYCGSCLKYHKYVHTWYSTYCSDHCVMEYHQNFFGTPEQDEKDWELAYIKLDTAHFFMDIYFEKGYYPHRTYVYSRAEMDLHGKAMPILKLPNSKIDIATLETFGVPFTDLAVKKWLKDLDDKLSTLALFA